MDLIVWFLGLNIRTHLGEEEGRYRIKENKNWRNYTMTKKQGAEN